MTTWGFGLPVPEGDRTLTATWKVPDMRRPLRLLFLTALLGATVGGLVTPGAAVAAAGPGPAPASTAPLSAAERALASGGARPAPAGVSHGARTAKPLVTHGKAVTRPSKAAPWVVSLWLEDKEGSGGSGSLQFLCSGSAISPREILTAAHCTRESGYLYALVGADTLDQRSATLIPIEAMGANSHYRDGGFGSDIAVVRPMFNLGLRSYAKLATKKMARSVRRTRAPLAVYGWGATESGALTGGLRTTTVRPASAAVIRRLGRVFQPATMIAAGRQLPGKRWAGTCSGDSGGPLAQRVGTSVYVVGVTDFGSTQCDTSPSVFASVGDYGPWATSVRRALPTLARTRNTALPVPLTDPRVRGTVALGQSLTCTPGTWTSNTTSVAVGWFRGDDFLGLGANHVIAAEDAGHELECVAAASSRVGVRGNDGPLVAVPAAPVVTGLVHLTGLPSYALPEPGTVASCSGATAAAPDTAITYHWLASPDGTGDPAAGAVVLASGPVLGLDADLLRRLAGSYLVCRATGSNVMGSDSQSDYAYLPELAPPSGYATIELPLGSAHVGTPATCSVHTSDPGVTVSYRWARVPSYVYADALPPGATILTGQTGPTYLLAAEDLDVYLACEATLTSWQGTSTKVASTYAYS